MERQKGDFIVIEGLDGSGKTIQSRLLADHLTQLGFKVSLSFEPTGGPVGSIIRQALVGRLEIDQRTLAALFAADRLDHISNPINGIHKHLEDGITEICDRYDLTSYAYQTRSVDEHWVWALNSQVLRPDLTIFLDVSPEECIRRLQRSRVDDEMFHDFAHLRESRERYLAAISKLRLQDRVTIIDGNGEVSKVTQSLTRVVDEFLATAGRLPL